MRFPISAGIWSMRKRRKKNREYDISVNWEKELEAARIKYSYREDSEKMKRIERALHDYRNGIYPKETDPQTLELVHRISAEKYRSLLLWDR